MSIEIKNITKMFGNNKALDDLTLTINKNQITGLIGFNGSGKTTTFNTLVGFIESFQGSFTFGGKPLDKEIKRSITYLAAGADPKNPQTALKHMLVIASMYGAPKKLAIEKINHYSSIFNFNEYLNKPMKMLSKGNQQKVKIISSFLNPKCKYIFLDEPFDGLDPLMVNRVRKEYMKLKGVTIVITSHRMEIVQDMVTEFYVLKDGVLVDAKKTTDKHIVIRVNKEVPTKPLSKLKEVISIKASKEYTEITIKDISNFKKINQLLIKSPKYIYSSYIEKNLAMSVFDNYEGGK